MKNLRIIALLLTAPLITSMTLAQTSDSPIETNLPVSVATARCQYTPAEQSCVGLTKSSQNKHSDETSTVAQFPRRMPGPPFRPRRPPMAHPRGAYPGYPGMAMEPSGRHVLIGALIGFGLGAAAGAKANTDQHPGAGVKAAFLVGSIGGLLGAAVGAAVPSFHARNPYRHNRWPEEDEQASRSDQGSAARHQGSGAKGKEPARAQVSEGQE
jgi:hypothetical protein